MTHYFKMVLYIGYNEESVFNYSCDGDLVGLWNALNFVPSDDILLFRNSLMQNALHVSAMNDHYECAQLLLSYGIDIDVIDHRSETPLMHAAIVGSCSIINLLLAHGSNIEGKDMYGYTPLMHAAYFNQNDAVRLLIEKKADIHNINNDGETACTLAIKYGRVDCAEQLIKAGSNIESKSTKQGNTPLIWSAIFRMYECMDLLLKSGANIANVNNNNCTALHFAANNCDVEAVELLLRRGANVNSVDNDNKTPLDYITCHSDNDDFIYQEQEENRLLCVELLSKGR